MRPMRDWLELTAECVAMLEPAYMDAAAIGLASRADGTEFVVYDAELVIELLMEHEDMDYEDAVEWYEFNTSQAWVGEGSPAFLLRKPT